jgi:mRNA-degrading endonuclease RelE of RelBE toxin-antitoxin system
LIRTVEFLPAALRDFDALDRLVQVRVTAALERLASTGHGDVKKLQGRPNDFRLRVGKWRVFFDRDTPGTILVTASDNRGQAY